MARAPNTADECAPIVSSAKITRRAFFRASRGSSRAELLSSVRPGRSVLAKYVYALVCDGRPNLSAGRSRPCGTASLLRSSLGQPESTSRTFRAPIPPPVPVPSKPGRSWPPRTASALLDYPAQKSVEIRFDSRSRGAVVLRELQLVELPVQAASRHELGVCPLFQDPAVVEHQDPVGAAHGARPMGDDQSCATP